MTINYFFSLSLLYFIFFFLSLLVSSPKILCPSKFQLLRTQIKLQFPQEAKPRERDSKRKANNFFLFNFLLLLMFEGLLFTLSKIDANKQWFILALIKIIPLCSFSQWELAWFRTTILKACKNLWIDRWVRFNYNFYVNSIDLILILSIFNLSLKVWKYYFTSICC